MMTSMSCCRMPTLVLTLGMLYGATPAFAGPRALFALVIGYNETRDPTVEKLHYADDDAVQNFQLMVSLGAEAILLTALDTESRQLYPNLQAQVPTLTHVQQAFDTINTKMNAARQRGAETHFYLFYSGHGEVQRGEGYVQLEGGQLPRTALLHLLRGSQAQVNHVIVDACKSYFLVFARGLGGHRRRAIGPFLPPEENAPVNTGFFLSTSSAAESHEWEAFQGGVFSHELRSALRGGADRNQDGLVTYEEAMAFVYTANRMVPNQRFRPRFFARPYDQLPSEQAVLIDLHQAKGRRVVVGPSMDRHLYFEDHRGIRLVDLHPDQGTITLLLPKTGKIFARDTARKTEYVLASEPQVVLAQSTSQRSSARARGAEHESFRRLFQEPFDEPALQAFRRRPVEYLVLQQEELLHRTWIRRSIGIFGLAALAGGGVLTALAAQEQRSVTPETSNLGRQQVNGRIDRNNALALTCYILGGTAVVSSLIWTLWPQKPTRIQVGASWTGSAHLTLSGWW